MKSKFFALLAVCLLIGSVAGSQTTFASDTTPDGAGTWTQNSFRNPFGQRSYGLYIPPSVHQGVPAPMLVMLHGCAQTALLFAQSTRMNTLADQYGFVVLYPEQDVVSNSSRCWNWFSPDNFVRGGGELGIITGMVNEVRNRISIDPAKIGVVGFSAGGAMASNLIACHSDLFSMAAINSGLEYKAASSVVEAYTAMSQGPTHDLNATALDAAHCTGSGAHMAKLLVVQGLADVVVNPKNSSRIISQFTMVNDLLDDGQANGSQNLNVISSEAGQVIGGHPFKVVTYGGNGHVQIRQVLVEGMPHAYSGGTLGIPFNDPTGPSTSKMAVDLLFSN